MSVLQHKVDTMPEPTQGAAADPTTITNLTTRITHLETTVEKLEDYSRRECMILTGLPRLCNQQQLIDLVKELIAVIYQGTSRQMPTEAIHYLGRQNNLNRTPPCIIKFSFRRDAEDFFYKFINAHAQLQQSNFKGTRINHSLSATSREKRKALLPHHLYLKRNGHQPTLRGGTLKVRGRDYHYDLQTQLIQPPPTWDIQQVERDEEVRQSRWGPDANIQHPRNTATAGIPLTSPNNTLRDRLHRSQPRRNVLADPPPTNQPHGQPTPYSSTTTCQSGTCNCNL